VKVLWLGPNYRHRFNFHHELFADEAARQHEVIRYGHTIDNTPACALWGEGTHVPDLVEWCGGCDVVVVQHLRHCTDYTGLDEVKVPTVALIVDYFPRNYDMKNRLLNRSRFDLACFPAQHQVLAAQQFQFSAQLSHDMQTMWLPFSVDIDTFRVLFLTRRYDAMAVFSGNPNGGYPNREAVARVVRGLDRQTVTRVAYNNRQKITHEDYIRLINQSKIAIASNDRHGSVNLKHLEIMACGALLMTDEPHDFQAMGYEAGKHYVSYEHPSEIPGLVERCADGLAKRAPIAGTGQVYTQTHHNTRVRVKQLFDKITELV